MITLNIRLSHLLMVLAAIGNNSYLLLRDIVGPIALTINNTQNLTLDTLLPISFSLDQLSWIFDALKNKPENDYAAVNRQLLTDITALASATGGSPALVTFLQTMDAQRITRQTAILKEGARFVVLPSSVAL